MLLGPFLGLCEQRAGKQNEILSQADINELRDLLVYANRFHHDTNPAVSVRSDRYRLQRQGSNSLTLVIL